MAPFGLVFKAADETVTLSYVCWEGGRLLPGTGADKILYVVTDHLGSVRVVKDGTGAIRQRFDYYPYGTVSRTWTSSITTDYSEKRYRFGGKEIAGSALTDLAGMGVAPGTPYLDFGARLYSPRTAMWLSADPLMEKYYGMGPNVYCAGSPVNLVDPLGKDWYIFNLDGSYRTSIPMVGIPLMVIASEDMQICNFYFFADPINDPVSINQGDIIKVTIIPESIVRDLLEEQRTFNPEIDIIDFVKASSSLSTSSDYSFDYSSAVLAGMFGGTKEKGEIEIKSNRLFLPEGSRFAHNLMNFGNFLWGASGYTIGIPIPILLMGAHANSLGLFSRNSRSYSGYDPQFDSFDDQLSILEGAVLPRLITIKIIEDEKSISLGCFVFPFIVCQF